MEFGGTYLFFASRMDVWQALNDEKVLKKAIPRCQHIDWTSETTLDLIIKVNLGIMAPKFSGELELSDIIEAKTYTLTGRGHGGMLGLAKGSAQIELSDCRISQGDLNEIHPSTERADIGNFETGTLLDFTAMGGGSKHIMALGKTLIGKSAQGIIDRFMGRFADAMDVPMLPRNEEVPPEQARSQVGERP